MAVEETVDASSDDDGPRFVKSRIHPAWSVWDSVLALKSATIVERHAVGN